MKDALTTPLSDCHPTLYIYTHVKSTHLPPTPSKYALVSVPHVRIKQVIDNVFN